MTTLIRWSFAAGIWVKTRDNHSRYVDIAIVNDKDWNKCVTIKQVNGRSRIGFYTPDLNWQNKGDDKIGYWG